MVGDFDGLVGDFSGLVGHFHGFVGHSPVRWTLSRVGCRLLGIGWTL
ncbi:hypothetical protein [Sporosarcina sp. E16_8]|nr:hypothetical protein [Sporosarcina sp. E16_8]MBO0589680.1 hypothetical protein [Sporosarcina sp. E16_8]